ncbi:MAG: hypothetical protein IKL55_01075 [Clostridia bacterium]|nr:hypothetical protein [Clostridia bacterium]
MKKILKKFLICILILVTLNNFFISNITYAAENPIIAAIGDQLEDLLGTVIGLLAAIPKLVVLPLSYGAQMLMAGVAYSQGTSDAEGNISTGVVSLGDRLFLTPFDIIFNQVALVDVNIFNIPSQLGAIRNIRVAVAGWYYVMRNIAATILLCVLIYVGIRMAISTIASDKAAYKKMLIDWCVSLALIFLLQYIIVFTFGVNSAFIKSLAETRDVTALDEATKDLFLTAVGHDLNSVAATVVICMLTWQTFSLLISYIQRMLKVSFLVIISPLITLTYSIDKMGDGKAQALNTWLKEFVYTVLLQPFHCIIYMVFVGMAIKLMGGVGILGFGEIDDNNLAAMILIILCIHFTKEAEKLLGKIFNFNDSVSGASLATGMGAAMILTSQAKNIGKGARTLVNGAKNFAASKPLRNARVELATLGAIMHGKSIEDAKASAEEKISAQDAKVKNFATNTGNTIKRVTGYTAVKGALNSAKEKATTKGKEKARNNAIEKETQKIMAAGAGEEAARKEATRRVDERTEKKNQRKQNIKNARTFISQSKTANMLTKQVLPAMVSTGVGVFVGAGSFGLGGNAVQSIMLGSGTYKGSQEFFKTSSKNVSQNTAALIQGAGAQDESQGREKIEEVLERSEEFEKASEEIDKIYAEIQAALGELDGEDSKKLKSRIKNVVDKQILENPSSNNAQIIDTLANDDKIQGILQNNNQSVDNFRGLESLDKLIGFQRDAKIYENFTTVGTWGLSNDAMIEETMRKFTANASTQPVQTDASQDGNSTQMPSNPPTTPNQGDEEQVDDSREDDSIVEVDELSPEDKKEFEKRIQEATKEQNAEIAFSMNEADRIWNENPNLTPNDVIKELRRLRNDNTEQKETIEYLEKIIKQMGNKDSFSQLHQKYKSKINYGGKA